GGDAGRSVGDLLARRRVVVPEVGRRREVAVTEVRDLGADLAAGRAGLIEVHVRDADTVAEIRDLDARGRLPLVRAHRLRLGGRRDDRGNGEPESEATEGEPLGALHGCNSFEVGAWHASTVGPAKPGVVTPADRGSVKLATHHGRAATSRALPQFSRSSQSHIATKRLRGGGRRSGGEA